VGNELLVRSPVSAVHGERVLRPDSDSLLRGSVALLTAQGREGLAVSGMLVVSW
jgi:hypothetical protein